MTPVYVALASFAHSQELRPLLSRLASWSYTFIRPYLPFASADHAEHNHLDAYEQYIDLSYPIVLAIALQCLSMVPNLGLYAQGKDRSLIGANVFSLLVFIVAASLLGRGTGATGIVYALSLSTALLFLSKTVMYTR